MEQRAQRPNLFGLCRVATEEEEDEVNLFVLCRAQETMEQREERLSLLRLSRVATEEDEVKRRQHYQGCITKAFRGIEVSTPVCPQFRIQ